jgi:hypothetical protein
VSELVKASLDVLDRKGKATETIPVQFNPTTLQLQMTNSVDGGKSRGRQTQQYNGRSSTQLSLTLEFDTADEGTDDSPVDVRTKTDRVRQFVLPAGKKSKQAPPRVKFRWGTFELIGVMNSLSEELSLFSRDGAALRSKLTVQIKEQDPKFDALERGPGANDANNPPAAGGAGAGNGPGTSGGGPIDRTAAAIAGETPADFLARNGLAPEAWRAVGPALDAFGDGVELPAGASIGFDTSLFAGPGIGVSAGLHVGIDASIGASLGLEEGASSASSTGSVSALEQGFALSAAGGVTAAAETAKQVEASVAADAARSSFGMASAGDDRAPVMANRAPLATSSSARTQSPVAPPPAPMPPRADERATTFGRGVPLRDRREVPGAHPDGYVVIGRAAPIDTTMRARGRRPMPWEQLSAATRAVADREQSARTPSCGCHRCDPFGTGRSHR